MKFPEDYQIPDDPDAGRMDASYLRTCLGLRTKPGEEPPSLPRSVRQAHFRMARALSVLGGMGHGMNPTQLATVIAIAGEDVHDPPATEATFLQELPVEGQKVVIHWRSKDRPAHFLGVTPDKRVKVLHRGSEVKMRPDLVRNATDEDFPEVPDNINQTAEV